MFSCADMEEIKAKNTSKKNLLIVVNKFAWQYPSIGKVIIVEKG